MDTYKIEVAKLFIIAFTFMVLLGFLFLPVMFAEGKILNILIGISFFALIFSIILSLIRA